MDMKPDSNGKTKTMRASMPNPKLAEQEPSLKGTFVSVLLLGAILAVSWLAVFILFLSRQ